MKKICEHCGKEFIITETEQSLSEKIGLELSTVCSRCLLKQHLSFWMFGKFRKGKSDLSGESMITVLPESRYPLYLLKEWHSDAWDAMDYGVDYNPSESFFKQLQSLQEKVPHPHQNGSNNTGCDYCDDVWNSKNCYLARSMEFCEDLLYSYRNLKVKNSMDTVICYASERLFSSLNCINCYKLFYSRNSKDCIDSSFLFDCRNCQDCFMCWNLRGKSYCIENIQYTREEYKEKLQSFNLGSYSAIESFKEHFEDILKNEAIHKLNFNIKAYNSTGDNLLNVNNCQNCNTISDSEDAVNAIRGMKHSNTLNANGCWYIELSGNCGECLNSYGLKYSTWSSSRFSEYLDLCTECEYCFGCVGLKKKKYCILNKQYTKEEYEKLKDEIINKMKEDGEYGKFLPYSMSAGPFNFSTSYLYFPKTTKEEILGLGGYWQDIDESNIEGMPTSELPDSINDVDESICTQALICPETGWRFNISNNELEFYKQYNIPLPRKHFDVRIKDLVKYSMVLDTSTYNCFYCKQKIQAFYPKEWGYQNIACENCYQQNLN
ncbi:TPA: hypothetical protein DEP30_03420 [Candidatus Nomurabacteria bacterium]|nr:MAG: hypothetical protein UR97_C0007G0030 [Candidatus Nomurabacteria bacterium GW2011_GWE2_36_115]KKP93434.1 MAG: hypothetical protein US00_C0007G0056 [Candidatus Nomurabacteria bacterium GW2011_GWF2_36_126]KKP96552.1 MAG: hypothetical protein US04_C0001G0054 [Candidatus Nomurabacteria bacterium GW2011_GWD2_36_14]KKP99844.1 MAG: hypothetical protein US08_C0001G0527 [Candidatus Nomurabacteria bacterium GW2011_GWF2_36_19]KKQ05117.1 MAG: hypothetical protein US17_C0007G0030 [Candidatus Nomuraba